MGVGVASKPIAENIGARNALDVPAEAEFQLRTVERRLFELLLGVGVAFKVYFVMAWRAGKTGLLQSSLTHAVLFSAATTAAASAT